MVSNEFLRGWDEDRVRRVLAHYEQQADAEAAAEDAAPFAANGHKMLEVPTELVPLIQELIAQYEAQLTSVGGE